MGRLQTPDVIAMLHFDPTGGGEESSFSILHRHVSLARKIQRHSKDSTAFSYRPPIKSDQVRCSLVEALWGQNGSQ
jgi:hypothetical protein